MWKTRKNEFIYFACTSRYEIATLIMFINRFHNKDWKDILFRLSIVWIYRPNCILINFNYIIHLSLYSISNSNEYKYLFRSQFWSMNVAKLNSTRFRVFVEIRRQLISYEQSFSKSMVPQKFHIFPISYYSIFHWVWYIKHLTKIRYALSNFDFVQLEVS